MKILGQEGLNFIASKYKELKESLSGYAKKEDLDSKIDKTTGNYFPDRSIGEHFDDYKETGIYEFDDGFYDIPGNGEAGVLIVCDFGQILLSLPDGVFVRYNFGDKWGEWERINVTSKERDKLNSIENGANKTTKLSQLTDDSTHRLVTDEEKTAWNNKLDSVSGKLSDLKYSTLKNLKPGFYQVSSKGDIADNGETLDCDGYGYLLLTPEINGSLFVGFDFFYPGFWVGIKDDDKKEVFWAPIINCVGGKNANERLSKIKEQVILTQSEYNALSSSEKNDESKIYFIKG